MPPRTLEVNDGRDLNQLLIIRALNPEGTNKDEVMFSNPYLMVGVMVALGAAMNFMRLWTFVQGSGNSRRARLARISDGDAHLSFDQRIAERMRELERGNTEESAPAPAPPNAPAAQEAPATSISSPVAQSRGFGRRRA